MLKNYVYQEKYTEQKFVKYMQRILFDRIRDVLRKKLDIILYQVLKHVMTLLKILNKNRFKECVT